MRDFWWGFYSVSCPCGRDFCCGGRLWGENVKVEVVWKAFSWGGGSADGGFESFAW